MFLVVIHKRDPNDRSALNTGIKESELSEHLCFERAYRVASKELVRLNRMPTNTPAARKAKNNEMKDFGKMFNVKMLEQAGEIQKKIKLQLIRIGIACDGFDTELCENNDTIFLGENYRWL